MVGIPKYDRGEMDELLVSGKKCAEVSKIMGCSHSIVYDRRRKLIKSGQLAKRPIIHRVKRYTQALGLRVGSLNRSMEKNLTDEEFEWILDNMNRNETTMSDFCVRLIKETAVAEKESK